MPIFIPDRLKSPGDFPSIDANDNQIRGFGFFADNSARTALAEEFRCHGYLAYMKDTDQFKQYNNTVVDDSTWGNDSNWVLLEGTTTDTYWAEDDDGTGIYYSNQVVVGASTYSGSEKFYVNGDSKLGGDLEVTGHIDATEMRSSSGIDFKIDTDGSGASGDDFKVEYNNGSGTYRSALDISPYIGTPSMTFGNIFDSFKFDYHSPSYQEFRAASSNPNEAGFKFTDAFGADGSFLIRMKNDASYFEMKDGGRDLTVTPHFYSIKSTVEANSDVLTGVEMLMPSVTTGDWTFNHLANKNFVFNTNTGGGTGKLITKFHSQGEGVVSIGTANYYNEYNGIQYPTYSASLQPRLFIVNDGTSNVGIRVQSGDESLGSSGARSQGRHFVDVRDDGFYISRLSTGPLYDDSEDVVEGEEWDPSNTSAPSAAIGMKRNGAGNSLQLFARNDLHYTSGPNSPAFSIIGDPNANERDLVVHSPEGDQALRIKVRNDANSNGDISFTADNIGAFLVAKGNENKVTSGGQILSSLERGAYFNVTSSSNPAAANNPSLHVSSITGKSDNTGYWWGADGNSYDSEADLLAAGTTVTSKQGDKTAIYVPKHGSGKVGIGTTDPRYGKLDVFGRIVSDAGNNSIPFWGYNMRNSSDAILGVVGIGLAANNVMVGGFNNSSVAIARHSSDGTFDDEIMGYFDNTGLGLGTTSPLAKLHVDGDSYFSQTGTFHRNNNTWARPHLYFSRPDENSTNQNVGVIGSSVNGTVTAERGYRFYLTNNARGTVSYLQQNLAILENGDVEIKTASSESSSNLEGEARLNVVGQTSDDTKNALTAKDSSDNDLLLVRNDGNVGIGTSSPLAKLHVDGGSIAIGDVSSYNGGLAGSHLPGEAPGLLFLNGGGLVTNGGTNIINSNEIYTNSDSSSIQWKPGNAETYRQVVLTTNNSSGIAFKTDDQSTEFHFGKYSFSITDNHNTVSSTVDKPLFVKPRYPGGGDGYTGGGVDGNGNVNQSLVHPLYFTYNDAPSTLENIRIRTQLDDAKGASYDYGLDYDATATQGDTGNPFTANKNRLKISATFPFAESQTDDDGRHTSLSGVIGTSEASFEIRNAYETNVSGGVNANLGGTYNTALYVGGQRFFEPRNRNDTILYGYGGVTFKRASNYGTIGDLSPEDSDLVNDITTDVTGGTAGSYVLSTSNSGEITLSSSTYDTSVDGELALKVTLSAADNISSVEILYGGGKSTDSTGFRSGDTITIPATKLGSSSTQAVITLSNNSFVTDGGIVSVSLSKKSAIRVGFGQSSISSNDTSTSQFDLGAGGSFSLMRTVTYTAYRDHWFKYIEGGESGHWQVIQGGFLKGSKLMVGYSNDNGVAYDGTAIGTANYGTAALRVVASPSGMRVGEHAVASNSTSVLKFAEADLDAAGFTDVSSTWGVDYDTDGGWYVGMPIYISEAGSNHMISKVRPDGVFQYNSGSDTSTFQRRIVIDIDNADKELTLDSEVTTSSGDVLVYPRTESDLIRCRNLMGRDMFVVKSNGRLDLENGMIKMRTADYTPLNTHIGSDECIIYWDGTNLKLVKGDVGTSIIA